MMSPDISSSTTAGEPSETEPTAPRAGSEKSAAGSGGLLANSRIATRVGALALLGAIGLVGVGIAYLAGDSRIAFEIGESDEQANLAKAASEVHILALLMRDSEQQYFARRDPAYVDAYEDHAEELLYRLESLAGVYAGHADHVARAARKQQEEHAGHAETTEQEEPVEDDHSAANAGSVDALNWLAQKHITLFRELVTLNELLGFAESEGLRGRMRDTSRAAERALVALDLDAIAAKLLRMRLHEVEFIARGDEQSVRRFDGRRSEINFLLGNARVDETKKENVVDLIDQYTDTFHGFATAYQAEGEARNSLAAIFSDMEPKIDSLFVLAEDGHDTAIANLAEVRATTRTSISTIVLFILVAFCLASIALVRSVSGPLAAMTAAMTTLARGDKSTVIPGLGLTNELGRMALALRTFRDNIFEKEWLAAAEVEASEEAATEKRRLMVELADHFETQVKSIVDIVAAAATEMEAAARQMAATVEETERQSSAVSTASEQMSTNVQLVATATEELSSSVSEIGRQVNKSTTVTGRAVDEARSTNDTVQGLAAAASKIGEVVEMISAIAGQTNLLALNATIEAARAGDAGKGFAVVAGEVKNLATQTARATGEIAAQIEAVQQESGEAVHAIDTIQSTITEVNEIAATIASAVEQQGSSTQEISRNIHEAAKGTQDVSSSIVSVNQAANDAGTAAGVVLAAASKVGAQAESLRETVGEFLQQVRVG